jgi:hypothetical protein
MQGCRDDVPFVSTRLPLELAFFRIFAASRVNLNLGHYFVDDMHQKAQTRSLECLAQSRVQLERLQN